MERMNLPTASGWGIMIEFSFYFSPQGAGNLTQREIKMRPTKQLKLSRQRLLHSFSFFTFHY